MKNILLFFLFIYMLAGCDNSANLSEKDRMERDSISRAKQRAAADSMKKRNPLLIVPPDSTYTGDYVDKYPGGIVKYRGQFRFGERHGQWMSFYPNGKAWSELHYDKGARHGLNIAYHENGKIFYRGYYKNDQQDSLWQIYDTLGKITSRIIYKNGRVIKELPAEQ